jgi:hypothetical protein
LPVYSRSERSMRSRYQFVHLVVVFSSCRCRATTAAPTVAIGVTNPRFALKCGATGSIAVDRLEFCQSYLDVSGVLVTEKDTVDTPKDDMTSG